MGVKMSYVILAQLKDGLCLLDHRPFDAPDEANDFRKKLTKNADIFSCLLALKETPDGKKRYYFAGSQYAS